MSSTALTGERRWASARRGGMTVLGKVAAPKPLNLPSQRLENHGLDPRVEIVPKGTLSWGSRPSSSGSNAWMSSSSSPNAGGGATSPSHLSARPSSGGSGTRPSTAGSDRTHETITNAWGPNSRPSSASGKILPNQTSSAPLRPRSAENRPNSSQLSRFAEPVSENSVAWGPSNTAERLGVKSSKEDFSLSSGDFPTLGCEKDHSVNTIESDHARPTSASGRISQSKEDTFSHADVKHGTMNTWRTDGHRSAEDGIHPNMEKWQGEPQHYYNANIPPQHFDAWRGPPPINAPGAVWYGGRPPGPPFGAPLGPGGFPMEPFPYYRPQIPPPPLAGSQPAPPSVGGPRGHRPKNGDLFRPQMPDAYARPGMPFRPGFYPGPSGPRGPHGPLPFEGYYGPPMGYPNNERDIPYTGMAAPPHGYNGYPGPGAPDIGNSHGRVGGRGPAGKTLPEQVEGDHFEDKQGPRRVPLRNHDEWDRKGRENWEHDVQPKFPESGKSSVPMMAYRKNEWGAEDTEEDMFSKRRPSERSSRNSEYRGHSADGVKVKSSEGMGKVKTVNDNWVDKPENVASFPSEMSHLPLASDRDPSFPAATKDPALLQKIEGLNAKIRVSDGRNDVSSGFSKEEQMKRSQREVIVQVGDKPLQSTPTIMSRGSYHGGQDRVDNRGKGKLNGQDADGWRKKPLNPESQSATTASKIELASGIHKQGPSIVGEAAENVMINPAEKSEGDSAETYDDSTDIHAQRAKMRELAKQRALQLQKEEEERTREQKAKALAKLEELNRRTLSGEVASQKAEEIEIIAETTPEQESQNPGESTMADPKSPESGLNLVSNNPVITAVDTESVEGTNLLPLESQQTGLLESTVPHGHPLPRHEDAVKRNAKKVTSSQSSDGGNSKHKRTGYKQKQNALQKTLDEKSVSDVPYEVSKDQILVGTIAITPSEVLPSQIKLSGPNTSNTVVEQSANQVSGPNTSNAMVEQSTHQRRKNNRNGKNKQKTDTNLPGVNLGKNSVEAGDSKGSLSNLDITASTVIEPDRGVQAQDGWSSSPNEESLSRVTNQWKPQPSRRMPRNQQPNRFVDKLHVGDSVKWAPVGMLNKAKGSDEASQKSIQESANSLTKGDNICQNNSKGKRAEMERYVPKPVAKDMAQQGSVPPLSSSIISDEDPMRQQSVIPGSVEINERDSKHKKEHGTWRQRGSTDLSHSKGANLEPSPTESTKHEVSLENAETKGPGVINTSDGYNISNNTTTASFSKYPAVKDQGATGRGKRYQPRVPRSTGTNNPDPPNISSGEMDESYTQSDVNQTDRAIASKENRNYGERTSSHWLPKSHSNAANNEHGNRASGSESVTSEINRFPRKNDHPQHKVQGATRHDKESGYMNESHPGQSNVTEESILGHPQDSIREKKPAPSKGRPYSPNQDLVGSTEQFERNVSSGSRRNWSQNSRSVKSHESRERPRQNMHYEYQPVGPYKGSKSEQSEEPVDNAATRFKERGQSHPKRGGNFHRRQGGAIRAESNRPE